VKLDALRPADPQRRERPFVLEASELVLDGCAAPVELARAELLIWDVDCLWWPALHGLDLDRLAFDRPVFQERPYGGSIRRLVSPTGGQPPLH
jgi:hypothetical protein